LEELYSKSIELGGWGLYVLVNHTAPHWLYIGRSTDLGTRVRAERRLRRHYSHAFVFSFPSPTLVLEVLKELEKRALRRADGQWAWARWQNRTDLFVRGTDPYQGAGSKEIETIVNRVVAEVERFMLAQPTFDPRAANRLPPTHVLGDCRGELHAFGRDTETGRFVVYANSRLTSSIATVKELLSHPGPYAKRAGELYRRGLIARRSWTHSRAAGLFLVRDIEISNAIEAAELLMCRPCEADPWRLATREEIDDFFVPEGSHRRW
jgi:hypothetical protein